MAAAADLPAQLDLVFMGTPPFAATILRALIGSGHRIAAVYTQPPRPRGRGHRLSPSPVQALAAEHGLEVRHPASLRSADETARLSALGADIAVVAAYGLILPAPILAAPSLGCVNVHASLLPRWRGAAPIQRAILAGDAATGVTIMQMDAGLDTGAMLLREAVAIGPETTGGGLTDLLATLGARLLLDSLDGLARNRLAPERQPAEGATYARKIERADAILDWREPAAALERRIRALDPTPGAGFAAPDGERLRVLAASVLPGAGAGAGAAPGTVIDDRLTIACGEGALRPMMLQRPGRGPVDTAAFLRGYKLPPGTVLSCPAIG